MYIKETESIIKKRNELIKLADKPVIDVGEILRLLRESENPEYSQSQRDQILKDIQNSNTVEGKIAYDNEITRLNHEIDIITKHKIKQMEEKRMTEPNMVAEPEPAKEKKTGLIKDKVAELEDDCYNYLKEKCGNDNKILVSLIAKLMNRSRIDKKTNKGV